MKILLCCAAGMSTSLVVEKMKKVAKERGLEAVIHSVAVDEFSEAVQEYDVALLGPQVKYKKEEFQKIVDEYGKKMGVINSMDYGLLKGDKILDSAIKLMKEE